MGMAVIFVMTMASLVTWFIYMYVLVPLGITYLRTIAFILVIATLVQFVEMVIEKTSPTLHKSLGIYLPLITTNCAVLGVAVINVDELHDDRTSRATRASSTPSCTASRRGSASRWRSCSWQRSASGSTSATCRSR